jgi:hypothetical protein
MKFIHDGPQSYESALRWARFQIRQALQPSAWPRLWGKWVVQLRTTPVALGWVEVFHFSTKKGDVTGVGYEFAPRYWGYGYATEAVSIVVDYSFDNEERRSWSLMPAQRICHPLDSLEELVSLKRRNKFLTVVVTGVCCTGLSGMNGLRSERLKQQNNGASERQDETANRSAV